MGLWSKSVIWKRMKNDHFKLGRTTRNVPELLFVIRKIISDVLTKFANELSTLKMFCVLYVSLKEHFLLRALYWQHDGGMSSQAHVPKDQQPERENGNVRLISYASVWTLVGIFWDISFDWLFSLRVKYLLVHHELPQSISMLPYERCSFYRSMCGFFCCYSPPLSHASITLQPSNPFGISEKLLSHIVFEYPFGKLVNWKWNDRLWE